jgi:hypothetical protein
MEKIFFLYFLVALTGAQESCNYASNGGIGCAGSCNVKNSVCEMIIDTDMLYCGCSFCNYDSSIDKCVGMCSNRQLGKCIGRVSQPKSDSDCACATCYTSFNTTGGIVCSGSCFQSGLSCKPSRVPQFNLLGYSDVCVCS